jgi:L-fuconolactonase
MPAFPIIDSHVHLYNLERFTYGWLKNVPKIARTHEMADFDEARGPVQIEKLVFAEVAIDPGLHQQEAAYIQAMADADKRLAGIIAHAPMEKGPAIEADLVALKANRNLVGIRRLIETERDPSFSIAPDFIAAVKLLPRHGLTFDICVKHWAMTYAIELVRRCPEVSFVLDHIGKPDIRNGLKQPWWDQIKELASLPNVVCKISGVVTEADHQTWTREQVKPYVARAIECFGFDRCMYGSDWTVSNLTHHYPEWVSILDEVISGASEAEQRALYRDTATRVYGLAGR